MNISYLIILVMGLFFMVWLLSRLTKRREGFGTQQYFSLQLFLLLPL